MSWRLTHLVLLALLASAAWSHPRQLSWVDGGTGPARAAGEADRPCLHPAGLPPDGALYAERAGQLRVEPRQPGVKAWLAQAACAADECPGWVFRVGGRPASTGRLRLHVLLCTWLI